MIAAPWYLLSLGIVILLAGFFLSALARLPRQMPIDPKMSDKEIAENLQTREHGSWANLVVLAGLLLIGISLLWRLLRWIL
jgi:uncharacterized membrane protein